PQVLTEGQDVATDAAQVPENIDQLLPRLPEAEHQSGLREEPLAQVTGSFEHGEGALVAGARPHPPVEPGDGLQVVVEDVDGRGDDVGDRGPAPLEVRYQNLDPARGQKPSDGARRGGEVRRPPVREVVP